MTGGGNSKIGGGGRPGTWGARLLAVAFWLVAWQLLSWAVDSRIILVGPLEVLARLGSLALAPEFWASVGTSLGRIGLGFLGGVAGGLLLAALAARVRAARVLLAPLMGALKAVPVASFVILVLLWVSSS